MSEQRIHENDAVRRYKRFLLSILEQRPSGTRQRLAHALGKNRSFVSQFTNPAYDTPIPQPHLEIIFDVCHFSGRDKRAFLKLYRQAHPGREANSPDKTKSRRISVSVPDLGSDSANRTLDRLVNDFAASTANMLRSISK